MTPEQEREKDLENKIDLIFGGKDSDAYKINVSRLDVCIKNLIHVKDIMYGLKMYFNDNAKWYNPVHVFGRVIVYFSVNSITKEANGLIDRLYQIMKFPDGFRTSFAENDLKEFLEDHKKFIATATDLYNGGYLNKYKLPGK